MPDPTVGPKIHINNTYYLVYGLGAAARCLQCKADTFASIR